MKLLVLNDVHLAVNRVAGTTRESVAAMKAYAIGKFRDLLNLAVAHKCQSILINGDLTDQYLVPLAEALEVYEILDDFMGSNPGISIGSPLGNHDTSTDSTKLGTVAFLGLLLSMKYGERFKLISAPAQFVGGVYVIPHVVNSDVFNLELSRVPEGTRWLALHSCFDNKFAAEAEHSLNLDRAHAKALTDRGIKLVLGHEHQGRESLGGKVLIVGNQFPSSISDCLHNDAKRALIINGAEHEFIPTWSADQEADGWFARIDWRELADIEEEGRGFIRVEGEASAEEAAEVVRAISAFRAKSKSFVVANAVKVESLGGMDDIAQSIEDIRAVDVIELLLEQLEEDQVAVIRKLIATE